MESHNPPSLDEDAQAGQDDLEPVSRSSLRRPLLPEVISAYPTPPAPHYEYDYPADYARQEYQSMAVISDEATYALADEPTITVPILSAQYVADGWERVLDKDEIDEDDTASDQHGAVGEGDFDDALLIDVESFPRDGSLAQRDASFALRERSTEGWKRLRATALTLLALVLMVASAVVGAGVASRYAQQATSPIHLTLPKPTVGSYSNDVVVQLGPDLSSPTPQAPQYQMGAWMSDNAPSGGTVTVFVRVSQDVAPLADIPVTLAVQTPTSIDDYGPTTTDAYGLATFTVSIDGFAGAPMFVTASAKIGEQELTADTVFVPI